MNALDAAVIAGEINATITALNKLRGVFQRFGPDFAKPGGRDLKDAVFVADILCRSYTCVETVFLRISRAFDNHFDPEGWHKDLLRKMRLEIPGVRPAVISESTFSWLDELRRFRNL